MLRHHRILRNALTQQESGTRSSTSLSSVKPTTTLGETQTPDGSRFLLLEHDGNFYFKLNGTQLMSSDWTESELLLADEACRFRKKKAAPRVLVGGLGLGFSLKRVLELVDAQAEVWVAELLPDVVRWNREHLQALNGKLLDEQRVKVFTGDVYDCLRKQGSSYFDAILMDVDNGPTALVQPQNARLYDKRGLHLFYEALRPEGRVSFWASDPEPAFPGQLKKAGFLVEELPAKAHPRAKRFAHRLYTGEKRT